MADADASQASLKTDARYRLTDEAVAHAKQMFNTNKIGVVAEKLGKTRLWLYRLQAGKRDPRLSEAAGLAGDLGLPIDRTFERCQ